MFGGRGADELAPVLDEVRFPLIHELDRMVETALEPDRRRRFRAHTCAAERARYVAWIELHSVRELEEALNARVEAMSSLNGFRREIGPGRVADQERIAGDDEPRLVAA